ncbi:MAG: hypothetical protein QGG36_03520 [Pirellulaceae bacterium]|nr:hypothetical protein [Pirellulaceae bacterium]
MIACLGAPDRNSIIRPVDVAPREAQMLRGASEATIAAQGHKQTPLSVRARVQDLLDDVTRHKVNSTGVDLRWRLHVGEWISGDQFMLNRFAEELARPFHLTTDRRWRQLLALHRFPPLVRVASIDRFQEPVSAKMTDQAFLSYFIVATRVLCPKDSSIDN